MVYILYYLLDIVDTSRAANDESKENLQNMNKQYIQSEKIQASFEKCYNEIDKTVLSDESNKQLEKCLEITSELAQNQRMFMKGARTVFSTVQVHKPIGLSSNNVQINCEKCNKVFHSQYAISSHNCAKKWVCDKCEENMINFHNYQKHIQAGCKLHQCNYCLVSMY